MTTKEEGQMNTMIGFEGENVVIRIGDNAITTGKDALGDKVVIAPLSSTALTTNYTNYPVLRGMDIVRVLRLGYWAHYIHKELNEKWIDD